jgi:hypothetical protein
LGNVPGQLTIWDRVFRYEPEQVRLPEESIEGAADFIAQPGAG